MNTPNLDDCSQEERIAFCDAFPVSGRVPRTLAARMFPDKPKGYVRAAEQLRAYAWNRRTAYECRMRGDIIAALIYERICDSIYLRLPAFARAW